MKQSVEDIVFRAREEYVLTTPGKELYAAGPSSRRLSKAECAKAVAMAAKGKHPGDVAVHFGIQESSVRRLLKRTREKKA